MAALLVLVTIALYWPVMRHDFISYDDPIYVTDNPHVRAGLSWEGLVWAFGRVHGSQTYWHPLTWVSHMVDCQLYGLKPGGHHLTSVLLHAANTVLVFLVFRRMTGAYWRCVTLAALFALHPLQVDSVAWVAERKTLLSAFFWLLSLWAYVRYAEVQSPKSKVQTPKSEFQSPKSKVQSLGFRVQSPASHITDHGSRITHYPSLFYVLSLFFTACGLMCKPVLVTLPFVLLLLDYWPLQRFQLSTLNAQRSTSPPLRGLELKTQDSRFFFPCFGKSSLSSRWLPPRVSSPSWPIRLWVCSILSQCRPGMRALKMPWYPMFATWGRPSGRPASRSSIPIPPPGRCGKWSRAHCCCWPSPAWF